MAWSDTLLQSNINEFVFFPNEQCTTEVYNDSINCGSSRNTLIENSQNAIVSKLQLSRAGILDEPFAGIEILFKDSNKVFDISTFDSIDLDLHVINGDTSGFNVMLQLKSRLQSPSYLPSVDTIQCGDPHKLPNRRHPYSVEHRQIGVEKYRFRYSMPVNSFTTPTWYGEGATLYREPFDKKRFYSLSVQTGSNVRQGVEYTIIISRIAFRKSAPVINSSNSGIISERIPVFLILLLSVLFFVISVISIIMYKKGRKKPGINFHTEITPEKEKKLLDYIHCNLGNSSLSENDIASHIGEPLETVERSLRLTQNMRITEYVRFMRLQKEAEYLFEKNHRDQIEWEIHNNREYSFKSNDIDDYSDPCKEISEPVKYDDRSQNVVQFFRDYYRDLKLDDEKSDDDTVVDSRIAKVIDMPLDDVRKILETCFGTSNKKYPLCHHLKVLRIEVAKKIMEFYIKNAKETYALKWLYGKVGFKEQDRLTKAWKETLTIIDETPNKFQDRLNKQNC